MNDDIVAVATALKKSAIAIIRVSGSNSIRIVNNIFQEKDLTKVKSHTISYGHIMYNNQLIDEVLISIMKSPKTYTKEDIVEINCHGGINTIQKILKILLENGCRLAEKGEFTKRAYLNGRINLLQAEAVNDLIDAQTDAARTLAINNVNGKLTNQIKNLREKIAKILANIEVNIDYPEYNDEIIITQKMLNTYLKEIQKELKIILDGANTGKLIKEGINVALIGKPNVGKSSILNHLLDEDKAIVSNIPGTTRDIVEGSITLNGVQLNFIDTAGIRNSNNIIEQMGVEKSKKYAQLADIILLVLSNDNILTDFEKNLIKEYDTDNLIIFVNKNDLPNKLVLDEKYEEKIVYGNTINYDGLNPLKNAIIKKLKLNEYVNNEMAYLTNLREKNLIEKSYNCLESALINFKAEIPVDVIEIDLKKAWEYLGEIIGESYEEELIDEIFKNFCLGK